MNPPEKSAEKDKVGQGFNDARGEVPDQKNIPKGNGLNVDNDPAHQAERERNRKP